MHVKAEFGHNEKHATCCIADVDARESFHILSILFYVVSLFIYLFVFILKKNIYIHQLVPLLFQYIRVCLAGHGGKRIAVTLLQCVNECGEGILMTSKFNSTWRAYERLRIEQDARG